MTEQEKINEQFQRQIDAQDARIDKALTNFDTKFNMMMQEIQQQREDMRRLWDRQDAMQAKHDADMKAAQTKHDAEMKAMQEKHDANMHEMNQRFYDKFDAMDKKIDNNAKEFTKQLHTNFIQTMLGFGAIAAAVGGIVVAAFK